VRIIKTTALLPEGGVYMEEVPDKLQWHPGFYGAAELELRKDRENLEFEREYNLSKEPLRVDLLIVKKRKDVVVENEIGRIFKRFNIQRVAVPGNVSQRDDEGAETEGCCHRGKISRRLLCDRAHRV
jgi:hypothetical protein